MWQNSLKTNNTQASKQTNKQTKKQTNKQPNQTKPNQTKPNQTKQLKTKIYKIKIIWIRNKLYNCKVWYGIIHVFAQMSEIHPWSLTSKTLDHWTLG